MDSAKHRLSSLLSRVNRRISAAEAVEKFTRLAEQAEREMAEQKAGKRGKEESDPREARGLVRQLCSQALNQGRKAKEALGRCSASDEDEVRGARYVEETMERLQNMLVRTLYFNTQEGKAKELF